MVLSRKIIAQLVVFGVVSLTAATVMIVGYMQLPSRFLGIGQYTVTVQLPESGGLYPNANVTYRGTQVGRVESLGLTDAGVEATLSLDRAVPVPASSRAEVHSVSAAGEQYVALIPDGADSPPLADGDTVTSDRTSVPVPINTLLDDTNRGLQAIPRDDLETAINETAHGIGGLGPQLSRITDGVIRLSVDARANVDALTLLIDRSAPVLDTQIATAPEISAWAAHTATVLDQVRDRDDALQQLLPNGAAATANLQQLLDRFRPTIPLILSNMVSVGQVALDYHANIEQLLVLLPQTLSIAQAGIVPNKDVPAPATGAPYLNFNLNFNVPPQCTTGFLPAQQQRVPSLQDYPDRPRGDLYCRVPQDSPFSVRGARNIPCATVPGKRAPTVKLCESDEDYVPLNDGYNWKGDPNATSSGQAVPQLPPGEDAGPPAPAAPPAPVPPVAGYDTATGTYVGPDGRLHTRTDLAEDAKEKTWQSMLTPPTR